ncbi:hypothetical protein DSL72_004931 [Monilinia vaccinii-corymbosi]|uniref:Rhodopsin domain-containing protein n=1 Tax=Monilinia vaccinii-corymbosi TaxID=61207 RepID=A0A8A3P833_9HELO|nr:hypothetical protein DSL72_004931 [Monilinia vaccinii-corymbosi]
MDAQAIAAKFPPGYLDDYNGHKLFAVCITAIVLDVFFVAARFTSRWIHNTPRGWDDLLIIPALIFSVSLAAEGLVGVNYCGVGYHIEYIKLTAPYKLVRFYKLLIFFPATYAIASTFPKLSLLAMYLRIFTVPFYRMVTYFLIYVLVVTATVLFTMILFQCTPVNYSWDKSIPGGKCHFHVEKIFLYASLPNIITDVVMLVLPLPFVLRLNMTRKVKIGLGLTLLTGSSGLVTSILRFVSFIHQSLFPDTTHASVNVALYTVVETSMYIVAACLPACRPLFNILRHPSRPIPYDQKETCDANKALTIDEIELHLTRDDSESGHGSSEKDAECHRGFGGRFMRLGSDADRFPGCRDSQSFSSPSPLRLYSPSSPPRRLQSSPPDHPQSHSLSQFRPQPNPRAHSHSHSHSQKEISYSIAQPLKPKRVHIADMHIGHIPRGWDRDLAKEFSEEEMDGIRVRQEFDVYYDRPPL